MTEAIKSADEAVAYIHSNTWTRHAPGLERMRELCRRLGDPQKSLRFLHVAGTNGKGSTCAMLDSVLRTAGFRVGLFTSPYLVRFNERIRLDGQTIPDGELAEITEYIRPVADSMTDVPTEFELITAVGLLYFARHACDFVVFEVGMGGRLDSTNILTADEVAVSVITGIAMDHTAYLGDTPEKIAAEKAGIIKPGVPVVFGGTHKPLIPAGVVPNIYVDPVSCGEIIRSRAEQLGAPYIPVPCDALHVVRTGLDGSEFDFGERHGLHIPLPGLYQPFNAATALCTLDALRGRGARIPEQAVRDGLAHVSWAGRFEVLYRAPDHPQVVVVADGGHNPEGVSAAAVSAAACFGGARVNLLTGVMADKDYLTMASSLAAVARRVFTVTPDNGRALSGDVYASVYREKNVPVCSFPSVREAFDAALADSIDADVPLLCLGSLYMYRDVAAAVGKYRSGRGGNP